MSESVLERKERKERELREFLHERILAELKKTIDALTDEERHDLFTKYCRGCGSKDNTCQCWNDE